MTRRRAPTPPQVRFLDAAVETLSAFPSVDVWAGYVTRAQPFVVRGGFTSDFNFKSVRRLAARAEVLVRNRTDGSTAIANLRGLVDTLHRPDAMWTMKQRPVPAPLRALLPKNPVPNMVGVRQPNMWLAPRGTVTVLHRDFYHNVVYQFEGVKEFTLLSPADDQYLYPKPLLGRYGNTTAIGEFKTASRQRFPSLRSTRPVRIELSAGDLLFLPAFWWHEVHTLESSLNLNYWWPSPLEVFLRPDIQEVVRSAALALWLLTQLTDLRPIGTDHDLVEKLAREGFTLFAAIVLGQAADDLLRGVQQAQGWPPAESGATSLQRIREGRLLDARARTVLEQIVFEAHDAASLLGERPPYLDFSTQHLNRQLAGIHRRFSITPWNSVCRNNHLWLHELKPSRYYDA